jgi:hypothetical protein
VGFWQYEPNGIVGKLMSEILNYGVEKKFFDGKDVLLECMPPYCDAPPAVYF